MVLAAGTGLSWSMNLDPASDKSPRETKLVPLPVWSRVFRVKAIDARGVGASLSIESALNERKRRRLRCTPRFPDSTVDIR